MTTLLKAPDCELRTRELRLALGGTDRSNLRRSIRGLSKRGLVEDLAGVHPRVKLTTVGVLASRFLEDPPESRKAKVGDGERRLREAIEERRRWVEEDKARWIRREVVRPKRNRVPGEVQMKVLAILGCVDPIEEGLCVRALKALVGADRANTRRAIRVLLDRGEIQESRDGRRLRANIWRVWGWWRTAPSLVELPDEGLIAEVLGAQEGADVVAYRSMPMQDEKFFENRLSDNTLRCLDAALLQPYLGPL